MHSAQNELGQHVCLSQAEISISSTDSLSQGINPVQQSISVFYEALTQIMQKSQKWKEKVHLFDLNDSGAVTLLGLSKQGMKVMIATNLS